MCVCLVLEEFSPEQLTVCCLVLEDSSPKQLNVCFDTDTMSCNGEYSVSQWCDSLCLRNITLWLAMGHDRARQAMNVTTQIQFCERCAGVQP